MTPRKSKANLGYHAYNGANVRVTAIGEFLYFRVRHSRQVTRVPIAECIPLGKPLAPVAQVEDPRQEVLPFLRGETVGGDATR